MRTATRDPREIITPDSFTVAPQLLGKPLAKPSRRAAAMLLDLAVVGIMVQSIGGIFLPVLGTILALRVIKPSATGGRLRRGATWAVTFLSAFLIVGSIFDAIRGDDDSYYTPPEEGYYSGPTNPADEEDEEEEEPRGARRLAAAVADDLGLGFGWLALYFTAFGVLGHGQTPGKRVFGIRIIRLDGRPLSWWISFERFGSYAASFSTGLLGFAQILWDRNRQALHDKAVETVVIQETSTLQPSGGTTVRQETSRAHS